MWHVCVISPIGIHPKFQRHRPVQFTHVNGSIFQNVDGRESYLSRDQALTLARWYEINAEEFTRSGEPMKAAKALGDARDLRQAVDERDAFWGTVNAWPAGAA